MTNARKTLNAKLEQALLDPASVFAAPEDVLLHEELSKEQKVEILRRWEYDESELAVADEEGMSGSRPSLLRRVLLALEELVPDLDVEHSPPTKHKGV